MATLRLPILFQNKEQAVLHSSMLHVPCGHMYCIMNISQETLITGANPKFDTVLSS
jgi:hypothetical protein